MPPGTVRFPPRCVECGAPPARAYALPVPAGLGAGPPALDAPLCDRCGERKSLAQLGWVAACVAAGVALVVALAVISDALLPVLPALRRLTGVLVALYLVLGAVPIWLGVRRGRRAFHRRFSAVWVAGADAPAGTMALGVRSDALAREIAAASGLAAPEGLAASPFRTAGAPPQAFIARGNPIPGWAALLVGLGIAGAGIAEYVDLGKAEARGETISRIWLEIIVYQIGGRGAVLGLFLVIGALCVAAGLRMTLRALR